MKKLMFFIIILISCSYMKAADSSIVSKWSDISAYQVIRVKQTQSQPLFWFSHEHVKFFLEARLNFDWASTACIVAGKTFSKHERFWVTPKAGFLFGLSTDAFNGPTFEVNFGGTHKRLQYFSMTQAAISLQKKNPFFFYEYVDVGVNLKYVFLSGSSQIYQEMRHVKPNFDIGPQIKGMIKGFYAKYWYSYDPINHVQKHTVGVGYTF